MNKYKELYNICEELISNWKDNKLISKDIDEIENKLKEIKKEFKPEYQVYQDYY